MLVGSNQPLSLRSKYPWFDVSMPIGLHQTSSASSIGHTHVKVFGQGLDEHLLIQRSPECHLKNSFGAGIDWKKTCPVHLCLWHLCLFFFDFLPFVSKFPIELCPFVAQRHHFVQAGLESRKLEMIPELRGTSTELAGNQYVINYYIS